MITIIGNGISAIICAICLDKLNIEYKIYGSGTYYPPELLYLKNDKYHLFDDYEKELVKVGYKYQNKIHDKLTNEIFTKYLEKQNRKVTSSAISDGLCEYYAINLKDVYNNFDKSKIIDKKVELSDIQAEELVFNTIFPIGGKVPSYLYVIKEPHDLGDYTYIYDCDDNNIKRLTANTTEYISFEDNAIKLKNYYDEPKIKQIDNIIYISRNASQTQLKIEDIIDYIFERFS